MQPDGTITLVIAEKTPLMQASLAELLSGRPPYRLAAVVSNGQDFLTVIDREKADIGIIGWELPGVNGRGILHVLRDRNHDASSARPLVNQAVAEKTSSKAPRIVVYTGSHDASIPRQAMLLGAAGFCSKNDPPIRLLEAIDAVASGRMIFPFIDMTCFASDPHAGLTTRERELLADLVNGMTNQQIAGHLGISPNTVKFHLKNLYAKLSVENRSQAIALSLRGTV